jgi:hypothetical protein
MNDMKDSTMQDDDGCFVHFVFFCDRSKPGDRVELMGSWLGWDRYKALKMDGSQYPMWSCLAQVPFGNQEFKLLLVRDNAELEWENRSNRHLNMEARCSVKGIFGNSSDCNTEFEALTGIKKCVRCGDVETPYCNCPKCWGPV